jgi:hypothetical protein
VNAKQFWTMVDVLGPKQCWLWKGHKNKLGYGVIQLQGHKYLTHRIAWTRTHGPIPAGKLVLHRCDNPGCVNPSHLFLGTQADNMRDRSSKHRQATGVTNGRAQLDTYLVCEMRRMYRSGRYKQTRLAKMFGISQSVVHYIVTGKIWKGVDWENF